MAGSVVAAWLFVVTAVALPSTAMLLPYPKPTRTVLALLFACECLLWVTVELNNAILGIDVRARKVVKAIDIAGAAHWLAAGLHRRSSNTGQAHHHR